MKLPQISLSTFNRKPFWISLIGGFMMAFMQQMELPQIDIFGKDTQSIMSASTLFETKVNPLLQKVPNSFKLTGTPGNAPQAYAGAEYDNANAYALVDLDSGQIIAEKNGDKEMAIASITKVMTAVVALDLATPTEEVTITEGAAAQIPTKIGVVPGQRMNIEELITAALLTSGNDATQAIKDGIDEKYGEKVFIAAMNRKAEILGLSSSHFTNPQGFDNPEHYSSAYDLAVLTHYAMSNYPLIAEIAEKDYELLPANDGHKKFDLYNWNGLVGVYPNIKGLKIGNTEMAGKTTIVVSQRNNKNLAVVLLGAPSIVKRDLWAAQLLDLGYSRVADLEPINITEEQLHEKYATWTQW